MDTIIFKVKLFNSTWLPQFLIRLIFITNIAFVNIALSATTQHIILRKYISIKTCLQFNFLFLKILFDFSFIKLIFLKIIILHLLLLISRLHHLNLFSKIFSFLISFILHFSHLFLFFMHYY